jgi:hypothetical protein
VGVAIIFNNGADCEMNIGTVDGQSSELEPKINKSLIIFKLFVYKLDSF